jgi:hypothetical protein
MVVFAMGPPWLARAFQYHERDAGVMRRGGRALKSDPSWPQTRSEIELNPDLDDLPRRDPKVSVGGDRIALQVAEEALGELPIAPSFPACTVSRPR